MKSPQMRNSDCEMRFGDIPRANDKGMGHAELHVALGEKEVWRQERVADTKPRDPYWLLFRGVSP
jgi:hypothetical protein